MCQPSFDIKKVFDSVPRLLDHLFSSEGQNLRSPPALDPRLPLQPTATSSPRRNLSELVSQGSILGVLVLLFNIFMDSIAKVPLSANAKLILYADDILLFKPTSTTEDDVNSILDWMKSHVLSPRLFPIIHSHQTQPVNLTIEDHLIPLCTSFRYFGVTLTSNLKWSTHNGKKVKRQLGMIHRQLHSINLLPTSATKSTTPPSYLDSTTVEQFGILITTLTYKNLKKYKTLPAKSSPRNGNPITPHSSPPSTGNPLPPGEKSRS